eukprot:TRINITY_DN1094_c0_g1_i1.p1 TRINITY_DN1094_c0_g1~~TRINITY_DN1094_c0_g1_i1.p1  ORF type:complete len:576 (-),score=231.43 TRINITY_DN1094_c0_g1_i1:136-1863(-)
MQPLNEILKDSNFLTGNLNQSNDNEFITNFTPIQKLLKEKSLTNRISNSNNFDEFEKQLETGLEKLRNNKRKLTTESSGLFRSKTQPSFSSMPIIEINIEQKSRIIEAVPPPLAVRLPESLLFDWTSTTIPSILLNHLYKEGRLEKQGALALLSRTTEILRKEPNVLQLEAPISIIGDVHGQFYDLVNQLRSLSENRDPQNQNINFDPCADGTRLLFLGDYVDRGLYSTEICFWLFSLKVKYPDRVFLLRGNHETRTMTEYYTFLRECLIKYDRSVYEAFMICFDCLPIAAVVRNSVSKYFCVHGGLSPHLTSIGEINLIDRFHEPDDQGLFCDLLWSDPLHMDDVCSPQDLTLDDVNDFAMISFTNSSRGCGWQFGLRAVSRFIEANNVNCIVRAHEAQPEGFTVHKFGYDLFGLSPTGFKSDPVITIFSAPNYCGTHGNKAAIMRILEATHQFLQFEETNDTPFCLPDFMNVFTWSLPTLAEAVIQVLVYFLSIMIYDETDQLDLNIYVKIKTLIKTCTAIHQTSNLRKFGKSRDLTQVDAIKRFEAARKANWKNELPPSRPVGLLRSNSTDF